MSKDVSGYIYIKVLCPLIFPKAPFVCPKDPWITPIHSYDLRMGLIPSILHDREGIGFLGFKKYSIPSCKLTWLAGKSTILMVFTRKDGIFMGYVSLPEGIYLTLIFLISPSALLTYLLLSIKDIMAVKGQHKKKHG